VRGRTVRLKFFAGISLTIQRLSRVYDHGVQPGKAHDVIFVLSLGGAEIAILMDYGHW
jgi:hypothetical protein